MCPKVNVEINGLKSFNKIHIEKSELRSKPLPKSAGKITPMTTFEVVGHGLIARPKMGP